MRADDYHVPTDFRVCPRPLEHFVPRVGSLPFVKGSRVAAPVPHGGLYSSVKTVVDASGEVGRSETSKETQALLVSIARLYDSQGIVMLISAVAAGTAPPVLTVRGIS